jgi:hypothetical protein
MTYQIQGLSIHAEVTGLRSRLSYFLVAHIGVYMRQVENDSLVAGRNGLIRPISFGQT